MPRQLHLNAFLMNIGHHEAAWRLPESDPYAHVELDHYMQLARIAERGNFDSLFLADGPLLWSNLAQRPAGALEPLTLLTALATATEHIGLIATASTTYNEPYNLARRFASLDIISGGRAGWNIVTTAGAEAARNFGLDARARARRTVRAGRRVPRRGAASSGTAGRTTRSSPTRRPASGATTRRSTRRGTRGRTSGSRAPSTCPRSPQGYPLLVQAGSSEDGKAFAARYAEAVFTAQQTLADAQAFYADLKSRTAAAGRDPEHIKVLPGIVPGASAPPRPRRARTGAELEDHIVYAHALDRWRDCSNCSPEPWSWTASCPPTCRPRTTSRAPRAATRWSSNWPARDGSPCGS